MHNVVYDLESVLVTVRVVVGGKACGRIGGWRINRRPASSRRQWRRVN